MKARIVICPHCGEENFISDNGYMGTAAYSCQQCEGWFNLFGQILNPPEEWEESIDEDY